MFFFLSKTAGLLTKPSIVIALIGVAGLLLMPTRWRRAGMRLVVASFVLLLVAGVSPLADILMHTLESRFPKWDSSRGAPDGVVVLGGAIAPRLSQRHGVAIVGEDAGRVIAIGTLARDYPNARIIYSGGDGSLRGTDGAEADYLQPLLDSLSVERGRVTLERRSRNTAENAAFSREIVQPKAGERWLLVTSAVHMPRAVGAFRQAGFPVEAYPVSFRTGVEYRFMPTPAIGMNLVRLDAAMNEWAGLLAYWLSGRSSALWPAP